MIGTDEGYAFFYWDRQYPITCKQQPCPTCYENWARIHKVTPAPSTPKRTYVGWFVPNSAELIIALRNIVRAGKRIHCEVSDNGPIRFYAEEV